MPWNVKADLKGPRGFSGDRGPQGLPGSNAIENDAAVAAYIGTAGASAAKTAVQATALAAVNAQGGPGPLKGNRIAVLGDSTARGVYEGDSEPGVNGAGTLIPGMSWLTWAAQLSGGRLIRHKNAGSIGDTIAMMQARVASQVIPAAPDACIVVSGYNDAFNEVTTESYMTSLRAIHTALRRAGIEMIAATPLSTVNANTDKGSFTMLPRLEAFAAAVRTYASDNGLQLLDFASLRNQNGSLPDNIKTDGDGVHPGAAGQIVLGKYVADALLPRLVRTASMPLPRTLGDFGNITPNPLFTGAVQASGLAPSVAKIGAADPAVVPSVTTSPFIAGNVQRFTVTGSTADAIFYERINKPSQWDVGDLLAVTAKVALTTPTTAGVKGVDLHLRLEFNKPPYWNMASRITEDTTRATVYAEQRITAADVSFFDYQMVIKAGTGVVDVGELRIYNLTKLGLA